MTICHSCNQSFADFGELAQHISISKKGHRKGKKWAAKYLLINNLSPSKKREQNHRSPLTEAEKKNKLEMVRELSGKLETTVTACPICHTSSRQALPIEYVESGDAWRTKSGCLIVSCQKCHR